VEVYCRCPLDLLIRRFNARQKHRHPAHPSTSMTPEWAAEFDRPMGLGPVVEVDTSQPVDLDVLAAEVACLLVPDS
jgi:hypothetical protein